MTTRNATYPKKIAALLLLLLGVACGLPAPIVERVVVLASPTVPRPSPTATARSTATATPSPTPVPTRVPTRTPAPLPTLRAAPTAVEDADLLFQTRALDVYAGDEIDPALRASLPDQAQRFDQITEDVERRLGTRLTRRVVLLVQPPEAGRAVRANCPARGAATRTDDGHLLIYLFADSETSTAQKEAVIAHEVAHQAVYTKLGHGGDTVLNEGLANWAIPEPWREWQEAPSFDSFVLESIAQGAYVPLTESITRNFEHPAPGEDCFETRDQLYNQWASFADFLIRHYGWSAIRNFWQQPVERGEEFDYRVGFGKTLAELEREWLVQLGRGET